MRILFAGTPDIAVPTLRNIAGEFTVCAVLTNPDRIRARGRKILPSPVKQAAVELGIPVVQPERLLKAGRDEVQSYNPDLLVTFAYGRIFGPKFLSIFPMGCINVHPSLLPELRGSSPIQSAILLGFERTGISVQEVTLEMDSGNVLMQKDILLHQTETTKSLTDYVSHLGAEMTVEVLHNLKEKRAHAKIQDHSKATYCEKLSKDDRLLHWDMDAVHLSRQVRAYYPWPKSMTTFAGSPLMITYATPLNGSDLHIDFIDRPEPGTVLDNHTHGYSGIAVMCGKGALLVTHLQLASKKEMEWKAFLNGNPEITGTILGKD